MALHQAILRRQRRLTYKDVWELAAGALHYCQWHGAAALQAGLRLLAALPPTPNR